MLQTQVAYWSLQENKRHNIVSESQNQRDLQRKDRELLNTINYNARQVEYWQGQLAELTRHNKATENLTDKELAIKRDQAKAALQQAKAALSQAETARADLVNRAKQANAALIQAGVAQKHLGIDAYNAKTNRFTAKINAHKTVSETGLTRQKTKTERKATKWYGTEHVAIPAVNATANIIKSVGSIIGRGK